MNWLRLLVILMVCFMWGYGVGIAAKAFEISPWFLLPLTFVGGYLIGKATYSWVFPRSPYN